MVDINKNPPWFRTALQCRYSGLPVSYPKTYISMHPGTSYFVDVAKLGDQIALVKASGNVRFYEMAEALRFIDEYVSKKMDVKTGAFLIEDYSDVGRVDFKARKLYIDHLKKRDYFWGGIFYNMSRLMQFSFKIAQRLHIQDNDAHAVGSYKQAISLAKDLISQRNTERVVQHGKNHGFQTLPVKSSEANEIVFRRVAGKLTNLKSIFFSRYKESHIREYSEALLKYIEAIDWNKDGVNVPDISGVDDKSAQKVFEAISYIKSEIDDLLKERDVSDQVLRKSEKRYRQLVEHAQAGIIEFDYSSNRITSVNDSFLGISGYSKEEVFSMNPLDLMTEESREVFTQRLSQRLAGKILSSDSSYEFNTKSGKRIWVLLNSNITYKEGRPYKADIVLIDITHLKEIENELVNYQSMLRQLSIRLSQAEEQQRRLLASQLHESVSQDLFATQLKLSRLEQSIGDPEHSRQLEGIKDQIVKSIKDIRGITYDLSPPVLYDLGLKEAVESLAKSIESKYRFPVKARFNGPLENINDEIKIITYRVIKEIVQNSVKHARADFVDIIIDSTDNTLRVDIKDNGIGFDADVVAGGQKTSHGFGLFDVREKINHLGGKVTIYSTPGSGTRIHLNIPLSASSSSDLKN